MKVLLLVLLLLFGQLHEYKQAEFLKRQKIIDRGNELGKETEIYLFIY